VGKHPSGKSFAEIVQEVEKLPPVPPPARDRAGIYAEVVVDPRGRVYTEFEDKVTAERALELASAGATVVWDSCGCGGGCGLAWFDADGVAAMVAAGVPDIRHTKRARGTISHWRSDAGADLLLAEGAVRWGTRLG
jgi:hypothetical protein